MNLYQKSQLTSIIALILLIGLTTGYTIGYFRSQSNQFPEFKLAEQDINEMTPTLKLLEVKGGKLKAELRGKPFRLIHSIDHIKEIQPDETFEIPLNQINLAHYYQTQNIPENALFIASKTGKYYYSVFNKSSFNLNAKNRIYFSSEEEARQAGYIKK